VFTLNGTKHTLTSNVSEHKVKVIYNIGFYATTISASSSQNNERMSLMVLYNKDSLKIGTYRVSNSPDLNSGNITFTFENDNGYSYVIQDFTNPNNIITITEIGADYIKGTFSAVLSALVPSGSQPTPDITITNGEFYAKTAPAN
jgi:hypothetical protein